MTVSHSQKTVNRRPNFYEIHLPRKGHAHRRERFVIRIGIAVFAIQPKKAKVVFFAIGHIKFIDKPVFGLFDFDVFVG